MSLYHSGPRLKAKLVRILVYFYYRKAVQRYNPKYVLESLEDFKAFIIMRMNCEGTRIAFTYTSSRNEIVSDSNSIICKESDILKRFGCCFYQI